LKLTKQVIVVAPLLLVGCVNYTTTTTQTDSDTDRREIQAAANRMGKYVHVWARSSDGTWKVIRYIINSDPSQLAFSPRPSAFSCNQRRHFRAAGRVTCCAGLKRFC